MLRALLLPLLLLAPESPPELAAEADRAAAVLRSIDGLALTAAPAESPAGARTADLRAALDRAREAFFGLALDDAIREASSVVDRFPPVDGEAHADALLLREAFVRMGQAHQAAGRADDARAALARAAGIGLPDALAMTDFPPAVVDAYETEKRRLTAAPRSRLEIETSPVGAEVRVDGLRVTPPAGGAVDVLATEHLVEARYAGRRAGLARVDAAGGPVRLSLGRAPQPPESVHLEVVRGEGGSIVLHVTAVRGPDRIDLEERADATEVEVAARRIGEALRDRVSPRPALPLPVAATSAPAHAPPAAPAEAPFYDRWWFWTAAGILIVASVAVTSQVTGDPRADVTVESAP